VRLRPPDVEELGQARRAPIEIVRTERLRGHAEESQPLRGEEIAGGARDERRGAEGVSRREKERVRVLRALTGKVRGQRRETPELPWDAGRIGIVERVVLGEHDVDQVRVGRPREQIIGRTAVEVLGAEEVARRRPYMLRARMS
jgi:hypothetical protein